MMLVPLVDQFRHSLVDSVPDFNQVIYILELTTW